MILDKIKKPNDIHKIPLAEFPPSWQKKYEAF